MKKIVSIILCLTFILGLFTVNTFAYTRPENIVSEFNDFENGVGDWTNGLISGCTGSGSNVTESNTTIAITSDGNSTHGKYLAVNNEGTLSATATLMYDIASARKTAAGAQEYAEVKAGDYFGFEFDFKLPSNASSATALELMVWDTRATRSRYTLVKIVPSSGKVTAGSKSYTISKNTWYKMKLEAVVGSALQRFIIMDDNGKELFISNINDSSKYLPTQLYGFVTFSQGGAGCEFYLDNTKAYTFSVNDINVGRNTATDDFEKYTVTASDANRPTSANGTGSWYFWGSDLGAANKRQIAIKNDGDKYVRIISDVFGAHSYIDRIAFGIPVSNKADVFGTATLQNPLMIGFKLRVADTGLLTDDEIRISLYNPTTKVRDTITSILPAGNAVVVGGTLETANSTKGLNMACDKWYDVKIFQNDTTDYQRVEITNLEDNKTQIFEGKCTYSFSDFTYLCFDATCYGKTCVDLDDVVITSMCGDYTQKLCDITGFDVDKEAVEVGNITASVDVKTYSYAENIITDTAKLILASYDTDGSLAGLKITDVKPMDGKYTVTLNVPDASYDVKAMLWDADSEGIKVVPLAKHIPLN